MIYKCTNKKNGKSYIGLTSNTLHDRIVDHKYEAMVRLRNNKFHKALREEGFENFEWEILKRCEDPIKRSKLEIKYIMEFNCIENGYNTMIRRDIK